MTMLVERTVPISPFLAGKFGLRWMLDREGDDPCDEWAGAWPDLPDGLSYRGGRFFYDCRSCEKETEWEGEPDEFEFGHPSNVCGGSPGCLP
jgi:hypothetical protein